MKAYLLLIQETVNEILERAQGANIRGAINWADLSCSEVCKCVNQDGDESIKILIEEADPHNDQLIEYVATCLKFQSKVAIKEDFEINTEW